MRQGYYYTCLTIGGGAGTVRVKIITGSLVTLANLFPPNYRYRYRLESRTLLHLIAITVTALASAVTPSFPSIPNYHLESYLN